ncbi:MFS transporter [Antrihabitans stalactiti]|uniref:MFS transporter n=1 Tax=Antrihabitans stalactiti TaxID=2584121 RepID=A0A848KFK6_9NOCA|nr:MFS transporter [Antrihabitans stalactiti]NMN95914.1 MFS transporter [Antrihabitans stalactiti]
MVTASFVIALGFGIVAPALPQYARSFGVGVAAASGIISAFALMRLLFAPLSGRLVQRSGERPIYLTGLMIVALSTGACAFAQEYWQLLVFRSLGGIGSTMFTVSSLGLIIRISPPHMRGRVSGLYATSFLFGSISGPLVGSALLGFGLRVPFAIYAVALLIAAAVVYFALRDSALAAPAPPGDVQTMTLRQAWAKTTYRAALWASFVQGWAVMGVRFAVIPLFVVETLHRGAGVAGIALTIFAVGDALVLIPAGRLSDRYGRKPFLVLGAVICGVSTIAMGVSESIAVFLVMGFLAGVGTGLGMPSQQAAIADIIGSKVRGGPVLAAVQMITDMGVVIGPIAAGALAQGFSYSVAFAVTGGLLLVTAVGWSIVAEPMVREGVSAGKSDPDD